MSQPVVSINETAERLGVCRTTVDRLIARGALDSSKIGARRLVHVASIDELLEPEERA